MCRQCSDSLTHFSAPLCKVFEAGLGKEQEVVSVAECKWRILGLNDIDEIKLNLVIIIRTLL